MSEQLSSAGQPKPGGPHGRINVAATLAEIASKDRDTKIADLEKVHQELLTRLGRAQV